MAESLINLIHLLATVVWLGGAIFMKLILEPAMKQIDPREGGRLMGLIAKRFTITAWTSIILLLITGYLKTPDGMLFDTSSDMGMILTVKHLLIVVVIIVGLLIALVVVPRMRRATPNPGSAPSGDFIAAGRQLHRLSMTSTIAGIAILTCAAFLW
ncbi:MAG TPA: DUF4149 domain-containing protein [Bacteroidota bacterium]|nr:DUF4149 domain-containing protein [Bacteroidota bacterium]